MTDIEKSYKEAAKDRFIQKVMDRQDDVMAYAAVRKPGLPIPAAQGAIGSELAMPQVLVDQEMAKWGALWHKQDHDDLDIPEPEGELPPKLSAKELMRALQSFRWRTGLGVDRLHPRHVVYTTDKARAWLGILLFLCESLGRWPSAVQHINFVIQGKPDGGGRLIGLLCSLYRIWAAARLPLAQRWAMDLPRPYMWACTDRGSEDAVADQLAVDEAAVANGDVACSVMLDLSKCYEQIPHERLRRVGRLMNFPGRILTLVLRMYAAGRRIEAHDAASMEIWTKQGIVAGDAFAVFVLRMYVTDLADPVMEQPCWRARWWVSMFLRIYIDDITLQRTGSHTWVLRMLPRVVLVVV